MIELFVNNREVILPSGFSFTMLEENPEITRKGEFTLDMTVSLLTAQNAIAFEFLNRVNKLSITKRADARMIINGGVHSGSIVIASNTDTTVTFQFVGGNSELNYIAKSDTRKIWELPGWGTETAIDYARALKSTTFPGYSLTRVTIPPNTPEYPPYFVCPPVAVGTEIANDFTLGAQDANYAITGISGAIIMQPYLLYYINRLPSLLGYTLVSNVLNTDARVKKMYLVNSVASLNYADALPDLTIAEFIEAIENFFNVSFLVDSTNKTISIESFESNLVNKKTVTVSNAFDAYERKQSEDVKSIKLEFTKVSYDFSDSTFFKYQSLSADVLSKCKIIECANFAAILTTIDATGTAVDDTMNLYKDMELGNDYLVYAEYHSTHPVIDLYSKSHMYIHVLNICLINKFKSYGTSLVSELILKLVPATILVKTKVIPYTSPGGTVAPQTLKYQLPQSSNSYFSALDEVFIESIENGVAKQKRIDKLEVALYTGPIKMYNSTTSGGGSTGFGQMDILPKYPYSHIDIHPEFTIKMDVDFDWEIEVFQIKATKTLRLIGTAGIIADYKFKSILDTTKEYAFTLIGGPDLRANNIFIINGMRYMPISFEREVSDEQETVKGKFYRMI